MALLTGEPRSATVRAETPSRVLRLERERFEALVRTQPSSFLAIARVLSRRLAAANRVRLVEEQALAAGVDGRPRAAAGRAAPGGARGEPPGGARRAGVALRRRREHPVARTWPRSGSARAGGGTVVRDVLRERLRRETRTRRETRGRAETLAARLAAGGAWEAALGVLAAHADARALAATLARALRAVPPLAVRSRPAVDRAPGRRGGLATTRNLRWRGPPAYEGRGDPARAMEVLRRALGGALRAPDRDDGPRLAHEISRLALATGERRWPAWRSPARHGRGADPAVAWGWPSRACGSPSGAALILVAAWPGTPPDRRFVTLLVAAIAAMLSRAVPDFAVGPGPGRGMDPVRRGPPDRGAGRARVARSGSS